MSRRQAAVVLSSSWRQRNSELSFVTRALAGAMSRCAAVTVVAPMEAAATEADGAFDVVGIGVRPAGLWPEADAARWSTPPDPGSIWILDEPSDDARALLAAFSDGGGAFSISPVPAAAGAALRQLALTPDPKAGTPETVGLHVPMNPLAATHRHAGFGFTGYVLVLSDRAHLSPVQPPTPAVAWLTSRFHDRHIVVVEAGAAAAWKGRALRGIVGVESRTDLWRLLAHASVTVDLAPGTVIGRECVESLLLGTPIVVPEQSTAAAHARSGGGMTFSTVAEMLDAVELLSDEGTRSTLAVRGRAYADALYGDVAGFVGRVERALALT